jgi:ribosome-associated protein
MNSEQLSELVVEALEEVKGKDIVRLDVSNMTSVTDYMVVASGTSNRHVKALAEAVAVKAKKAGHRAAGPGILQPGKTLVSEADQRSRRN